MDCEVDVRRAAEILKVLGQETRLKILLRLRSGEHCVNEFCPDIGEQSNISRHLATLKAAGLIRDRREGTRQYYRVVEPGIFPLIDAVRDATPAPSGLTDSDQSPN